MFLENTGDSQKRRELVGGFIQSISSSSLHAASLSGLLIDERNMPSSAYENVVIGKLKLKGDPLSVKGGGISKKTKRKKKKKTNFFSRSLLTGSNTATTGDETTDINYEVEDGSTTTEDRLTAAERRYLQQRERIEVERLAKMARKSHRDRIQEFNQYLANLSEHYDIPKVGPG